MCAISICRLFDPNFSAPAQGVYANLAEYYKRYMMMPKGRSILLDEVEDVADSRRSMSDMNVDLSRTWAKLRVNQIVSVCTLPDQTTLDKRLTKAANIIVLCLNRKDIGKAKVYYTKIGDVSQKLLKYRFRNRAGHKELYTWEAMDDDPDYLHMAMLKEADNKRYLKQLVEKYGDSDTLKIDPRTVDLSVLQNMYAVAGSYRQTVNQFNLDCSHDWLYRKLKNTEKA